jgi:PAS domain S-box-containing protein
MRQSSPMGLTRKRTTARLPECSEKWNLKLSSAILVGWESGGKNVTAIRAGAATERFVEPSGSLTGLETPSLSISAESILANTPFLLSRCSADLRYVFVSEAYGRMIGRTSSEVAGKKILEVMGEQGFKTILPHIEAVLSGQRVEYECPIHFAGVGARLLHVIYTPDTDEYGCVKGWIASITDITEKRDSQKRIAADLHATEVLCAVASDCVRNDASFDSCLEKLLDAAIDITGAAKGNLQLLDISSRLLRIVSQRGFGEEFLEFFDTVEAEGAAACSAAMTSRSPVIVCDVSTSEIFKGHASLEILNAEAVRAVSSFPLVSSRGCVLGVVSTHFMEPHEPQKRELRFMDLLTRIAADYLQREQAQKNERMLVGEIQHRSNNLLTVVQALAAGSHRKGDFEAFEKRLLGLARSNRLMAYADTGRMSVFDSVSVQVEPFSNRVIMCGPDIMVTTQQAQNIGIVMHELVTNAAKYGAFSNSCGIVQINWENSDSQLRLTWKEKDGPPVVKPDQTGFGTKLLMGAFPNATIDFAADGLFFEFQMRFAV